MNSATAVSIGSARAQRANHARAGSSFRMMLLFVVDLITSMTSVSFVLGVAYTIMRGKQMLLKRTHCERTRAAVDGLWPALL